MKKLERLSMVAAILLFSAMMTFAQQKPDIHTLTTGGTTTGTGMFATAANYATGQATIGILLDAASELKSIVNVTGEQIVKIGSQDMNDDVWLTLAKKINQLLKRSDINDIVTTHGANTMEETTHFLNPIVKNDKPIVLVGVMRLSTALSADGPLNLYNAVVIAGAREFKGKGVLVATNGSILDAANALKMNTVDVRTFQAPDDGALGYVLNGKVTYSMSSVKKRTTQSVFSVTNLNSLPKAGIAYSCSNIRADIIAPMLDSGHKGTVHVGIGNGNIHKNALPILIDTHEKGILVIYSLRVPTGSASLDTEVDDAQCQFIASQELNLQKSRISLIPAPAKTNDWKQIQEYFNEY